MRLVEGWMDERTDGWTNEWKMDGWMDGWMDGRTDDGGIGYDKRIDMMLFVHRFLLILEIICLQTYHIHM